MATYELNRIVVWTNEVEANPFPMPENFEGMIQKEKEKRNWR